MKYNYTKKNVNLFEVLPDLNTILRASNYIICEGGSHVTTERDIRERGVAHIGCGFYKKDEYFGEEVRNECRTMSLFHSFRFQVGSSSCIGRSILAVPLGMNYSDMYAYTMVGDCCGDYQVAIYNQLSDCWYITKVDGSLESLIFPAVEKICMFLIEKKQLSDLPKTLQVIPYRLSFGGDPEFELVGLDDKFIPASTFFCGLSTEIGVDGRSSILELRPQYAFTEEEYVYSVSKLIYKLYRDFKLSIGGNIEPLGGHIHIGGLPIKSSQAYKRITQVFDDFLGEKLIRLSGRGRKESVYYTLGAYQSKPYGMEYRSLPSTIYANPEILRIVYKLIRLLLTKMLDGKGLEYTYPVRCKEYLKFLTTEEVDLLIKFIRYSRSFLLKKKNYIINWEDYLDKEYKKVKIFCRGGWNRKIKKNFKTSLRKFLRTGRYNFITKTAINYVGRDITISKGLAFSYRFSANEEYFYSNKHIILNQIEELYRKDKDV